MPSEQILGQKEEFLIIEYIFSRSWQYQIYTIQLEQQPQKIENSNIIRQFERLSNIQLLWGLCEIIMPGKAQSDS